MSLKTFLIKGSAASLLFFAAVGCGQKAEVNETPEEKLSVEFAQTEVSVPVNGTQALELNVTPADRAGEVIVTVADESVISIESSEITAKGISLSLKALKLSSTTIYAIHDDLDAPAECVVSVAPIGVQSISLDKTTSKIKVAATDTLSLKITPEDATSPLVSWKSDNEAVATVEGGVVTAVAPGEAVITATCSGLSASCNVSVYAVYATSLSLSVDGIATAAKLISVGEKFKLDADILPKDVSYRTVEWSVEDEDIVSCEPITVDGNTVSAYITALKPGKSGVSAKISDGSAEGCFSASIEVSVQQTSRPSTEPKIGDYYYSDGTWSDGGLVSINEDGTGAVWLTGLDKPAPDPNKTVIGIVFQTNQERISETEKALGFTHGLVFCLKAAFAPIKTEPDADHRLDSLTRYSMSSTSIIANLTPHRGTEDCYSDIEGYSINQTMLSYYPKGSDALKQYPAFDWINTDFAPAAPVGTSGWYIPSSGQVWDLIVNLCGDEVANVYANVKDGNVDLYRVDSYYPELKSFSFNPVEKLNSYWSLVPAEMKHNLKYSRESGSSVRSCELMTSSLYLNSDSETDCIIYIMSTSGELMPFMDYTDDSVVCHPVLSF